MSKRPRPGSAAVSRHQLQLCPGEPVEEKGWPGPQSLQSSFSSCPTIPRPACWDPWQVEFPGLWMAGLSEQRIEPLGDSLGRWRPGWCGVSSSTWGIWSSSRMGPLLSRAPCVQGRSSACPPHQHGAINKVSSSKFKAGELEAGRLAGAEKEKPPATHHVCSAGSSGRKSVLCTGVGVWP